MPKEKRQYFPTDVERAASLADVAYEIEQMLFSLEQHVNMAAVPDPSLPHVVGIRNGLLESALIHARALLDFFERGDRTQGREGELDDVLSRDFGIASTPIPIPTDLRLRLNKDLAHLTYSRTSRSEETRKWRLGEMMVPLVARCLDLADVVVEPPVRLLIEGTPTLVRWHGLRVALRGRLGRVG